VDSAAKKATESIAIATEAALAEIRVVAMSLSAMSAWFTDTTTSYRDALQRAAPQPNRWSPPHGCPG